jgi:hypothetical protein
MSKTHVIDGVTYVEVNRKAMVGEKVIALSNWTTDRYSIGDILTVVDSWKGSGDVLTEDGHAIRLCEYHVLEPIETEASPQVTDLLANLARRVSSLEQQLRDTQRNTEKLAEELANVKHQMQPKEVEVVTFEKFLDSVADDVSKKLAEKVTNDLRTEMRLKALRGF